MAVGTVTAVAKGISPLLAGLPIVGELFGQSRQMGFQERMANTSYQRAVQDMRKAGINPMLAYMKGGADSPSGSAGAFGAATSAGINNALQLRRQDQELSNMRAQERLLDSQKAKTDLEAATTAARLPKEEFFKYLWTEVGSQAPEVMRVYEAEGLIPALMLMAKLRAGKGVIKKSGGQRRKQRRGLNERKPKNKITKGAGKAPVTKGRGRGSRNTRGTRTRSR